MAEGRVGYQSLRFEIQENPRVEEIIYRGLCLCSHSGGVAE